MQGVTETTNIKSSKSSAKSSKKPLHSTAKNRDHCPHSPRVAISLTRFRMSYQKCMLKWIGKLKCVKLHVFQSRHERHLLYLPWDLGND